MEHNEQRGDGRKTASDEIIKKNKSACDVESLGNIIRYLCIFRHQLTHN